MVNKICHLSELAKGPMYDISDPMDAPEETYLGVAKEIMDLLVNSFEEIIRQVSMNRHA
jgi:hypothetical protein